MPAPASATIPDEIVSLSYPDLISRHEYIETRLSEIALPVRKVKAKAKATTSSAPKKRKLQSAAAAAAAAAVVSAAETADTADTATTTGTAMTAGTPLVPIVSAAVKTADIHWDFLMKEMMWLATDFTAERKRHGSSRRRLCNGVRLVTKSKAARAARELTDAETRRRKLAARLGREVKGWWSKMDRVVSYKQKLSAEQERQAAMNKQLVALVKQTERYSESLARQDYDDDDGGDDDDGDDSDDDDDSGTDDHDQQQQKQQQQQQRRRRRKKHHRLTIEEALANAHNTRRSKTRVTDYARMQLEQDDSSLYGESTADSGTADNSGGSDVSSYTPEEGEDDSDDETTFLQAQAEETRERRRKTTTALSGDDDDNDNDDDDDKSFVADPIELRKLQEESTMDVDQVLERFRVEGIAAETGSSEPVDMDMDVDVDDTDDGASKKVTFAPALEVEKESTSTLASTTGNAAAAATAVKTGRSKRVVIVPVVRNKRVIVPAQLAKPDPGTDADDDADASDVEDFVDMEEEEMRDQDQGETSSRDGSEEFEADAQEVDDETTMAQEENLPSQMTAEEEIQLLNEENEMSVEELRQKYAAALEGSDENEVEDENENGSSSEAAADSSVQEDGDPDVHSTGHASLEELLAVDDTGEEEDFAPAAGTDVDDETTFEAEEKLGRDMTYEEELALLQNEGEMPIEQLRAMYASVNNESEVDGEMESEEDVSPEDTAGSVLHELAAAQVDDGENDEFEPNDGDAVDDETTMDAEEKLGKDMSYEEEIALLKRESEMTVEELKAMYAGLDEGADEQSASDVEMDEGTDEASVQDGEAAMSDLFATDEIVGEQENDDEFSPDRDEQDDEATMEAEDRLGREMSPEEELAMLKEQSEIPIESLRSMYQQIEGEASSKSPLSKRKRDSETVDASSKKTRRDVEEDDTDTGMAALEALEASAERAQKTLASRPYLLTPWVKLREYQQIGLNWLVSLQSRRLNGILADEMGLGKTLQTIALFSYLAAYKGIWGPHLVVVPTSVIINWETELKRFAPALKVLCYYGSAKRRKELRTGWTKTNWYHVVITSYQLAVQDAFAFKRKRWYYLVLDEAQNIKNFQSQRWQTLISFNTQRRLLLTGTPLQNNLMELWSLLHFLMPYIFRSRKEFSYWFANPMNNMIEGVSNQNDEVIGRLHGIIRPFILRRLKKDVETQMPGKYEHIVKCQLSRRQMFIYEEYMARSSTRQSLKKGGNFMGMMNVLMQLRKVCNHPDLFEPRSVITPFVLEPIDIPISSCVSFASAGTSVFDCVSGYLCKPLWCGSRGEPSLDASMRHDTIESLELRQLEASLNEESSDGSDAFESDNDYVPALKDLLKDLRRKAQAEKRDTSRFLNKLNSWRCQAAPSAYSSRLVAAVTVAENPLFRNDHDVASTPLHLLSMRRTQRQRADDAEDLVKKFVFCVPKAGARRRPVLQTNSPLKGGIPLGTLDDMLLEPLEDILRPFRKANARLSSFFPDKKLVQFDAGKLQTLAELLRKLKKGGHRVLIFTQMSKMLDILETFLNLNGHVYLRLDGSTGVERRQRLMERFNNDPKLFCFILSTRSGGLGINLTGADTVIFYDSDWNPAMDAQAQDRAHRIGQTRDVHIYRLVTEHTVEENILMKAQQKRNLDILVMDKGKFDASQPSRGNDKASSSQDEMKDVYTKGGLRSILGAASEVEDVSNDGAKSESGKDRDMSGEQMESAMATLEDADDVQALRGAQKEAADELLEFDETIEYNKDADPDAETDPQQPAPPVEKEKDEDTDAIKEQKKEEEELEKEFATWQSKVGMDASAIEASLSPTERYGLRFREEIDPFYSIFAVMEQRRRMEAEGEQENEIDIDEIERMKARLERQAIEDGELLATRPAPEDLVRQRNLYLREKSRLKANKKRRQLTGENWESKVDGASQFPFWYNSDTGEALWDKPRILLELEELDLANEKGWIATPMKALVRIMDYLVPFPDRMRSSEVCRHWSTAANSISFVRHVYPVEMGAYTTEDRKMEPNHYRTISEALSLSLPGDTIELGDGHYWINEDISVDIPLRIIGDENSPSNVIIEMSGTLKWRAKGGWLEGVTFRRPKISSEAPTTSELLLIEKEGRLDVVHSVFNNESCRGSVITVTESGSKGHWENVIVKSGDEPSPNEDLVE